VVTTTTVKVTRWELDAVDELKHKDVVLITRGVTLSMIHRKYPDRHYLVVDRGQKEWHAADPNILTPKDFPKSAPAAHVTLVKKWMLRHPTIGVSFIWTPLTVIPENISLDDGWEICQYEKVIWAAMKEDSEFESRNFYLKTEVVQRSWPFNQEVVKIITVPPIPLHPLRGTW
jgi:hypothetical protein